MGELLKVDPAAHTMQLNNGELSYDYLVLSIGAESNYFGMENIRRHAIPMKNVNDALEMRNTLLQAFRNGNDYQRSCRKEKNYLPSW